MSKFQIITLAVFIIAIIAGAASFALYKGSKNDNSLPAITVWGTFPANTFSQYVSDINSTSASSLKITYVEQRPDSFARNFVNALALGQGPDAILIPAEMLLPEMNKLTVIPYTALPKAVFFNSYIDEARIYLSESGSWAVPFTIDPLVMYWNRDTFNTAGIAKYPQFWDEFTGTGLKPGLSQKLTVKDQNGNIRKSALAMGDFANITNAREIMGSLLLQSNNPITRTNSDGILISALSDSSSANPVPAFQYFSQFANPANINYSWNRAMPNDKTAFLAGTLATYFSFASDIANLRTKNPNLNFDVAPLPQLRTGGVKAVYGKMYGFSLVRQSSNLDTAFQIISILTSSTNLANLSKTMYLPSVRRDVIAQGSTDPYLSTFNETALVSKTWLDANIDQSNLIFGNLVQSITSGQKSIEQAVRDASDQYDVVLRQQ